MATNSSKTSTERRIVALAIKAHNEGWCAGSDVSRQTRAAQTTCLAWQRLAREEFPTRVVAEHPMAPSPNGNEKIDLVDMEDRIAYEMKVSPNNTHMEFYRDVFKVLVFNRHHEADRLRKLVFLTPEAGAKRLRKPFPLEVCQMAADLGLEVEVVGIWQFNPVSM